MGVGEALAKKLEELWEDIVKNGIPAGILRGQLRGGAQGVLPPGGNTGAGYTPAAHDHASTTDGGKLTNDEHDGYSIYEEISAPSSPAANTLRLYAKDKSTVTELFYKNSAGTERDLSANTGLADQGTATYLDFTNAAAPSTPASGKTRIYTKTDKSFYQKDDAGVETGLTGGSGGATINTGADASKGTGTAGDLYLPNDGISLYRSTGSAQVPWGPIYPLADPASLSWSWVNQGGASIDTTHGGIYLLAPASGSQAIRIRTKAAPTPPYVIDILWQPLIFPTDYGLLSLGWRESGSGKLVHFRYGYAGGWQVAIIQSSNANTDAAAVTNGIIARSAPLFIRLEDDATNRKVWWSEDGQHYLLYHSEANTTYLTADQVFFGADTRTASHDVGLGILSWYEH